MELKKPSLKGMNNMDYLGHFKNDKFLQKGHNDSGPLPTLASTSNEALLLNARQVEREQADQANKDVDPKKQEADYQKASDESKSAQKGKQMQKEAAEAGSDSAKKSNYENAPMAYDSDD